MTPHKLNVLEALEDTARSINDMLVSHREVCEETHCNVETVMGHWAQVVRAAIGSLTELHALDAGAGGFSVFLDYPIRQIEACLTCHLPIAFSDTWRHLHTGTLIVSRCHNCGWRGPNRTSGAAVASRVDAACPACETPDWLADDHVAVPDYGDERNGSHKS